MGVKGLWEILDAPGSNGRRCFVEIHDLSQLRGKVLAVDVSIWLHQFTKAIPPVPPGTDSAAEVPHLVLGGLFQRVAKLLHYGIRPVFVFDGAAPALKSETMSKRHLQRAANNADYQRAARKLLQTKLKLAALQASCNDTEGKEPFRVGEESARAPIDDFMDLTSDSELDESWFDEDRFSGETGSLASGQSETQQASFADIDIKSAEFKKLPFQIQEQILLGSRKRTLDLSRAGSGDGLAGAVNSLDFSKAQVEAVIKRRRLMAALETIRGSSVLASSDIVDFDAAEGGASVRSVASNPDKAYVFVKNSRAGWSMELKDAKAADPGEADDEGTIAVLSPEKTKAEETAKAKREKASVTDMEDDDEFLNLMFGDSVSTPLMQTKPEHVEVQKVQLEEQQKLTPTNVSELVKRERFIELPAKEAQIASIREELALMEELYAGEMIANEPIVSELIASEQIVSEMIAYESTFSKSLASELITSEPTASEPIASETITRSEPLQMALDEESRAFVAEAVRQAECSTSYSELVGQLHAELRGYSALADASAAASTSPARALTELFMEMLKLFGLPFMRAPFEAEAQCASMEGIDGIISEDSDCLLFGASRVYRGFFGGAASRPNAPPCRLYCAEEVEKGLRLCRADLIALAHLLGCDYCTGVPGFGPKRALELIALLKSPEKGYSGLEGLLEGVRVLAADPVADDDSVSVKRLKRLLNAAAAEMAGFGDGRVGSAFVRPIVEPFNVRTLRWNVPDAAGLSDFMALRAKWPRDRTRRTLELLQKKQNETICL